MNVPPCAIDERFWERLQYRGAPLKQHVLAQLPASAALVVGDLAWRTFKHHCAAQGNVLPRLIAQTEPQGSEPGMFRRRGSRKPRGTDPFTDLPPVERRKAEAIFARLCAKWAPDLPSWRRAILAGVARRLALHPPDSEWGRRMRRIKGGVHCQRKYREQGNHPLATYNQAMAKRRKDKVSKREVSEPDSNVPLGLAAEARARLGITAEQMRGVPRIEPLLESVEDGMDRVVEGLRWSQDEEARAFIRKYDSVPPADLEYVSIDEICVAAGVDTRQLLALAVDSLIKTSFMVTSLQIGVSLPNVARATVKAAKAPKGWRDRRLLCEVAGLLSVPQGPSRPIASNSTAPPQPVAPRPLSLPRP